VLPGSLFILWGAWVLAVGDAHTWHLGVPLLLQLTSSC